MHDTPTTSGCLFVVRPLCNERRPTVTATSIIAP